MVADLSIVIKWWLCLLLLGITYWPLTRKVFSRFFDGGYLFAKVLGIGLSSYIAWILASTRLIGFGYQGVVLSLMPGLVLNLFLANQDKEAIIKELKTKWAIFLGLEVLFLAALVFWSFVRGLQPDIQGLEKFMDFGFVNSILRSGFMPPADMWFAGGNINYYYFGHFITAWLTILSGIASAITYNLMLATLFAFTFGLAFTLAANLVYLWLESEKCGDAHKDSWGWRKTKRVVVAGLAAGLLMSLGANLHPAWYNFKMGVLKKPYCDGATTYWYPNATRFIGYCPEVEDKTIHEFPAYSFVVSDLHGHVSDIPFVLMMLAMTIALLWEMKNDRVKTAFVIFKYLPFSLLLAIQFMTNQWDFPIYLLILGLALLAGRWMPKKSWRSLGEAVLIGGVWLFIAVVMILPFQLNFEQIAKGAGLVRAHSLFYQLLILWGGQWLFGIVLATGLLAAYLSKIIKSGVIKLGESIKIEFTPANMRKDNEIPQINSSDILSMILLAIGTVLVIIPEIVYVKDIYIASYHRANTMFKLTYQTFVMSSVLIGYALVRAPALWKGKLARWTTTLFLLVTWAALMVYPWYSIRGYYGQLKMENYKGLYGLNFLNRLYPDDYRGIVWLNQNITGQPVVLEAAGDSYTDYDRVSMATGLPTVEGWLVHEWLWRGAYDEPGKRAGEVQQMYETNDLSLLRQLLDNYKVKYVFVGHMERQKYTNINEVNIAKTGNLVFQSGDTKIYQVQ